MFNGPAPFEKRSSPKHVHSTSSRSTRGSTSDRPGTESFHNRSKISEKRYTADSEESLQSEIDPSILESYEKAKESSHARKRSHHRTKSIYVERKPSYQHVLAEIQLQAPSTHIHAQSEVPKHSRKASDADSVVLAVPGDESFNQRDGDKKSTDQSVSVLAIGFADPRHPANLPDIRASTRHRMLPVLGEL